MRTRVPMPPRMPIGPSRIGNKQYLLRPANPAFIAASQTSCQRWNDAMAR